MQRPVITAVALLTLFCASCEKAQHTTAVPSQPSGHAKDQRATHDDPPPFTNRADPNSPEIEEIVGAFKDDMIGQHPSFGAEDLSVSQRYFFFDSPERVCVALVPNEMLPEITPGQTVRIRAVRRFIDLGGPKGTKGEYANDYFLVAAILPFNEDTPSPQK